jgi:hypothetical protein
MLCPTRLFFLSLASSLWIVPGSDPDVAAMTNQVALFTGFAAGPGAGMDILQSELSTIGIPNYEGMVFEWTQQQDAFDWIQQRSDRSTLVLIGHSFGGNSALQLANDFLKPAGVDIDLTIQIDSVANFGSGWNDQLPTNVDVGINYYQISTGLFEPQGEDNVQGATNINVEVLFDDTSITHTSIDNDARLHALIGQNITDNLNYVRGDTDRDGDVDNTDLSAMFGNFTGANPPPPDPPFMKTLADGDTDQDGDVDDVDLAGGFGNYTGSLFDTVSALSVPELSSPLLATIALMALLSVRRRGPVQSKY